MKILFLNVPMQGHINPTLPVVKELVEAGHVVDYYCSKSSQKKIEATGANFKDYDIEFLDIDPTKKFQMINGALKFVKFAKATVDKFLIQWKKEDYDLIINDSCAYAGIMVGKLLNIKVINSTTTMFHTMDTMKNDRMTADGATRVLTGDAPAEPMGMEPEGDISPDELEMEPTVDQDEFDAAPAAQGGEEAPVGREKRA